MAFAPNNTPNRRTDDYLKLQDLLAICLKNWAWFALSLALCLGYAVFYLLSTPPVYSRSASLLIKEDGKKGSTISSEVNSFVDMGLFSVNTNVVNEQIAIQSPDLLQEVIRRLNLDVDYQTDARLRKETLYGLTLPVKAEFLDLAPNDYCSLGAEIGADGNFILTDFRLNGETVGKGHSVTARPGEACDTPVGRIVLSQTGRYAESAYAGMNLYISRSGLQAAIDHCRGNLNVSLDDDKSTILNIAYKDVNTQRADEFLNTLISVYNENWVKDKNQVAVSTSRFINERLRVIESELGDVDDDISSYRSEHLIPDIAAATQMHMTTANQAGMQISELNNQLYMARYVRDYVNNRNNRDQLLPANTGIGSAAIEQQIAEYNEAMLLRNSLVAHSSTANPLVVDLDAKLEELRGAVLSSIDNQMSLLDTQIKALRGIEGASTSRLVSNPKQSQHLQGAERQQKVKESLYLYLLQKREENELSQAFTAYNTRVITAPTGSSRPVSPNRRNILLAALLLGLLIPAVILFIRENANTKVRGRKDLADLKAPFLGEIPLYRKDKRDKSANIVVVQEGRRDAVNEAFRVVRTNLEFVTAKDDGAHVITVTSFNPGSGKSFLTMNLAVSLAIKKKRVLVIDGDLRRASCSAYVNSPRAGLSDFLSGKTGDIRSIIVRDSGHDNLAVLPVGTIPPNPTELLFDDRLPQLIAELRREYEYIFIDCPPIDIVADMQILERLADRTLFVVRSGLLEKEMLPELDTMYDEQRLKNLSVVLNGTETSGGRYGYRYGYHYGYGHDGYYSSRHGKSQGWSTDKKSSDVF